jgi:transcriptional regulator with XRE-family HTH domain
MKQIFIDGLNKHFRECGLSFRKLAAETDISENALQSIFNGKVTNPHLLTLLKLSKTFKTTVSEILCDHAKEKVIPVNSEHFLLIENFEKLSSHGRNMLIEILFVFTTAYPQK